MKKEDIKKALVKTDQRTFTKISVRILLIIGVIGGFMPYILDLCGKEDAYALGIAWVTEIIGVILGYMCKAHFDRNKERENDRLDKEIES